MPSLAKQLRTLQMSVERSSQAVEDHAANVKAAVKGGKTKTKTKTK